MKKVDEMTEAEIDALLAQQDSKPIQNKPVDQMTEAEMDAHLSALDGSPQDQSDVIQEMPNEVFYKDRAVVKNFTSDPNAAVNYLKKQYPGFEVEHRDGNYLMKKPGEQKWKTLDPDTGMFSSDFLKDVGDIGYDAVAGLGTTIGTALGGTAGLAAGPGGALAGGAAAGGVSSGALEAARQYIGKGLGIDQEIDGTDIGVATGVGAVSPLLFGTGANAAQLLKSAARKKAVTQGDIEFLKSALKSQRGAGGRMLDYGKSKASAIGNLFSGIDKMDLETAASTVSPEMSGLLDKATKQGLAATGGSSAGIAAKIKPGASNLSAIEAMTIGEGGSGKNPFVKNYVKGMDKDFADSLSITGKGMEKLVKETEGVAPIMDILSPFVDAAESAASKVAERPDSTTRAEALKSVISTIEDLFGKNPKGELSAVELYNLKQELKLLSGVANLKEGIENRFAKNATGAQKELSTAALTAMHKVTERLGKMTGGKYTVLNDKHAMISDLKRSIAPSFRGNAADGTLRNLASRAKEPIVEHLLKFQQITGKDYLEAAKLISAYNTFSKAPLTAMSRTGVSGAARTALGPTIGGGLGWIAGYGLGSKSEGGGYAGGRLGTGIGAATGLALTSPAMLKMLIKNYQAAGKAKNKYIGEGVKKAVRSGISPISQSTWLGLYGDKGNK